MVTHYMSIAKTRSQLQKKVDLLLYQVKQHTKFGKDFVWESFVYVYVTARLEIAQVHQGCGF